MDHPSNTESDNNSIQPRPTVTTASIDYPKQHDHLINEKTLTRTYIDVQETQNELSQESQLLMSVSKDNLIQPQRECSTCTIDLLVLSDEVTLTISPLAIIGNGDTTPSGSRSSLISSQTSSSDVGLSLSTLSSTSSRNGTENATKQKSLGTTTKPQGIRVSSEQHALNSQATNSHVTGPDPTINNGAEDKGTPFTDIFPLTEAKSIHNCSRQFDSSPNDAFAAKQNESLSHSIVNDVTTHASITTSQQINADTKSDNLITSRPALILSQEHGDQGCFDPVTTHQEPEHIELRKLFCGNIGFSTSLLRVADFFSQFGAVEDVSGE